MAQPTLCIKEIKNHSSATNSNLTLFGHALDPYEKSRVLIKSKEQSSLWWRTTSFHNQRKEGIAHRESRIKSGSLLKMIAVLRKTSDSWVIRINKRLSNISFLKDIFWWTQMARLFHIKSHHKVFKIQHLSSLKYTLLYAMK